MSGYIKLDKDTEADPRLLELADRLMGYLDIELADGAQADIAQDSDVLLTGFSETDARALLCNAMLGGLVRLWTYADMRVRNDDTLPLSRTALAQVMRLPDWIVHLFPADWLVDRPEIGGVELPGYTAKNGITGHEERREDKELKRVKWRDDKRRQRLKRRADNGVHRPPKKSTLSTYVSEACPPDTGTGPVPVRPLPGPAAGAREHPALSRAPLARADGPLAARHTSEDEDERQQRIERNRRQAAEIADRTARGHERKP